jgi:hypothetical protein
VAAGSRRTTREKSSRTGIPGDESGGRGWNAFFERSEDYCYYRARERACSAFYNFTCDADGGCFWEFLECDCCVDLTLKSG